MDREVIGQGSLDWISLVQGKTSRCSCVYGNKPSGYKKGSEFLESTTSFAKMILSHLRVIKSECYAQISRRCS
jgi:hypothetical protein